MTGARHLYVHVPFCAHRCGYCDFVTVTGADDRLAARYVDALVAELRRHAARAAHAVFGLKADPEALDDAVRGAVPAGATVHVEAGGVRVSLVPRALLAELEPAASV